MAEDIAIRHSLVVNGISPQRHKAGTFPPDETTPGVLGRITCGRGTVPVPGGSGGGRAAPVRSWPRARDATQPCKRRLEELTRFYGRKNKTGFHSHLSLQ